MNRFNKESMCSCGGVTFTTSQVLTKVGHDVVTTSDTYLKCMSCLKEYIRELGESSIYPITQEAGKHLVRTAHKRYIAAKEEVLATLETSPVEEGDND